MNTTPRTGVLFGDTFTFIQCGTWTKPLECLADWEATLADCLTYERREIVSAPPSPRPKPQKHITKTVTATIKPDGKKFSAVIECDGRYFGRHIKPGAYKTVLAQTEKYLENLTGFVWAAFTVNVTMQLPETAPKTAKKHLTAPAMVPAPVVSAASQLAEKLERWADKHGVSLDAILSGEIETNAPEIIAAVIADTPLSVPEIAPQTETAPKTKRLTKKGLQAAPKPQSSAHSLHPSRLIGIKGKPPRSVPLLRTLPPYYDTMARSGVNVPKLHNKPLGLIPLHLMTGEAFAALTPERILEYGNKLHRHAWDDWNFSDNLKTAKGRVAIHRVAIRYEFNSDSSDVPTRVLQSHALEAPRYNARCWFARELSKREEIPPLVPSIESYTGVVYPPDVVTVRVDWSYRQGESRQQSIERAAKPFNGAASWNSFGPNGYEYNVQFADFYDSPELREAVKQTKTARICRERPTPSKGPNMPPLSPIGQRTTQAKPDRHAALECVRNAKQRPANCKALLKGNQSNTTFD